MKARQLNEELISKGSGLPRSKGLHVSDIIRDIGIKLGVLKKKDGKPMDPNDRSIPAGLAEMGFMWEDMLSHVFGDRMAARLPEVELDGISGSPDGMDMYKGEVVNAEYKCTWKSANRKIEDQWMWLTQCMAYCKMLGLTKTIIRVLHVNGDYSWMRGDSDSTPATYAVHYIEFTQRELDENWTMIVNHAKSMGWLKQGRNK